MLQWSDFDLQQDRDTCLTSSGSSWAKQQTQCFRRPHQPGPRRKTRASSRDHFSQAEEKSSSTFPRPLQPGPRRKLECLLKITSVGVIHLDVELGESTLRVGSPDSNNASPLRSLPPLLDTTQQQDFAICGVNHTARLLPHFKRYMPPIQRRPLRMEAYISACQSQQPSTVIQAVTKESQLVNHMVMEIRTISYDSQGIYTLRARRKGSRPIQPRKIENTRQLYKFIVTFAN